MQDNHHHKKIALYVSFKLSIIYFHSDKNMDLWLLRKEGNHFLKMKSHNIIAI